MNTESSEIELKSENHLINIENIYKTSFKTFLDNIVVCIANTVILIISTLFLAITVIGVLAIPAVWGGYTESIIRMSLGRKVEIGDFFRVGFNHFGALLVASIFYFLGIIIGLLFFIIPGLYLMIRWFFVLQIIVYEKIGTLQAFKKSKEMTSGIFWNVFTVFILNVVISTIGEMTGILVIVTIPYVYIVCAKYYLQSSKPNNE